jgi:DNA invertase Pin-like site-specific DNA recombinase
MAKIGVGLIRVSTGAQANEDRASIPAQREIIRQIAARYQIQVVKTFELADISGAAVRFSPEYEQFLRAVEDPRVTCVITREFSRLMRPERFDDFAILQIFVDHGITLYFPSDVLDLSNRQARFMAGIRAGVAGLERADIAERIASAKEIMRRRGEHPCGEHTLARGLGYTREKGWYYDESELESVKLLFRLFLGGLHVYETLSQLTGIPRSSVPVILRNPVYAGWMVYSDRKDPSAAGYVPPTHRRKGYRKKAARTAEEVIRIRLPLTPIIGEDEHQQILEIVNQKRRHFSSARADAIPRFTYRGFLYCGQCSAPLYTWAASTGKDFYHCKTNLPRYRKQGAVPCPNRHMSRHLLEPRLDETITRELTNRDFLIQVIGSHLARVQSQLPSTDELLRNQFENLQKKRERIKDLFIDGNITRLEKNELLSKIDNELDSLCKVQPIETRPAVNEEQVTGIVSVFRDWSFLQMEAKRDILTRVIPEVFVYRYAIKGATLRLGYNSANHPKTEK